MKRSGFSLLEMLAAMSVLAILLFFIAQSFDLFTKTTSSQRLQPTEQIRNGLDQINRELRQAMLRNSSHRFLNFYSEENSEGVFFYFCYPSENAANLSELSSIRCVGYFWNKKNLYRAEYKPTSYNTLEEIVPSYQSSNDPYAWIPNLQTSIQESLNQPPLIENVSSFEILFDDAQKNNWSDSTRLPQFIQLTMTVGNQQIVFSIPVISDL